VIFCIKLRLCLIIHHILEAFRCHVLAPNAAVVIIYHCHSTPPPPPSFYSSKLTMPRDLPTLYIVAWRLMIPDGLQITAWSVVNYKSPRMFQTQDVDDLLTSIRN
jgi:hypothetical protein